ncbi:MAG: hypothetical protein ACYDG2_26755 [Ruminiclostridium sp.]
MEIIEKINTFASDIYFKMPVELNNDYIDICTLISEFFDTKFKDDKDVLKQKNDLLNYLLGVMQSNDYIKMADALRYKVKPILEDSDILI